MELEQEIDRIWLYIDRMDDVQSKNASQADNDIMANAFEVLKNMKSQVNEIIQESKISKESALYEEILALQMKLQMSQFYRDFKPQLDTW